MRSSPTGPESIETENYTFEQISNEGRSRRLTIRNVDGDVNLQTKYWVSWLHSGGNHWNNLNNPSITGSGSIVTYTVEEDDAFNNADHRQELSATGASANNWTHTWTLGGKQSSHSGYDYPMTDDNGQKYLYYIVELDSSGNPIQIGDSSLDGFILTGYSANNNLGVSSQGKITVYNQKEGPASISVDIKKTDDAPDSTHYLEDAVFALYYREDAAGTWVNAASVQEICFFEADRIANNTGFVINKKVQPAAIVMKQVSRDFFAELPLRHFKNLLFRSAAISVSFCTLSGLPVSRR